MVIKMDILKIIIVSAVSLAELFLLTKLIGNRQMSELNMFDYINGITIGSIAAEMATSLDKDIFVPMTAMAVYGAVTVLLSYISTKSIRARRLFVGKSIVLFRNGKVYKNNLKVAKLDVNEFISQCRISGFFDLSQIDTAILEPNGRLSVLPKADCRPLTPSDMSVKVFEERPQFSLIIDGNIIKENLKSAGVDEKWLKSELDRQKINSVSEVTYASYDSVKNTLNAYVSVKDEGKNDMFM